MNGVAAIPLPARFRGFQKTWIPVAIYGLIAALLLRDYIAWGSVNFLIGLAAMPVMTRQPDLSRRPARAGWMALGFGLLCVVFPVKTALYLAIGCAVIFCWEQYRGRLTALPFLTILLMSPVAQYFAQVFSFPIRLWLTGVAGSLLQSGGLAATAAGNIITCGAGEYAVDPACMGLNMLVTSLLCGCAMIAAFSARAGRRLPIRWILAAMAGLIALNIMANLLRIMMLVYFRLLPENPMHEGTGVICLVAYVLLPAAWGLRRLVNSAGRPDAATLPAAVTRRAAHRLHWILLPCILAGAARIYSKGGFADTLRLPAVPAGYSVSWYDKEVIRVSDPSSLTYLKPVRGAIYTDHNPLLCWTGSGYGFDSIRREQWGSVPLYTGVLSKGGERLYTAWWYDNGRARTVNQLRWRWDMLRGSPPFTIINVTSGNPAALREAVARISRLQLAAR